jgi:Polyketide cyclase / dehydrase and lipid transport
MPHIDISVDSDVPAARVLAAATDFSDRRPEYWPNIDRGHYRVHGQGEGWAEATEGSPSVWARERYEWSGNRVVGTTQESNVFHPGGTWTLTAEPQDGGSRVRIVLDRRFKGRGWLFYPAIVLFGERIFERNLRKTLDVLSSERL